MTNYAIPVVIVTLGVAAILPQVALIMWIILRRRQRRANER